MSDRHKAEVLEEAQQRARELGQAAMKEKLAAIGLEQHEWDQYGTCLLCDDDADDGFLSYAMCSHAATVYSGGGGAPLLRLPVCVRACVVVGAAEAIYSSVSPAIAQLRAMFQRMNSRQLERTWARREYLFGVI